MLIYLFYTTTFNIFAGCSICRSNTKWLETRYSNQYSGFFVSVVEQVNYSIVKINFFLTLLIIYVWPNFFLRICINLQIGPNIAPRDAVALHIALDFTRNLIVRNSIQGQNWGVEETHGPPVALIRGQPFKLDIMCDMYEYKVSWIILF